MTVSEDLQFKPEFPEIYTWGRIDSPTLSSIANSVVDHIEHDLRNTLGTRHLVPGLRKALAIISEYASV